MHDILETAGRWQRTDDLVCVVTLVVDGLLSGKMVCLGGCARVQMMDEKRGWREGGWNGKFRVV